MSDAFLADLRYSLRALLALTLAAIGLYGMLSLAIGARRRDVVRLMLAPGLRLGAVVVLASGLPARRAGRTSPVEALRHE